jgi:hypothetical protein
VADRERVWLEDMVMHHMMAVRDARLLLARGFAAHPEVEALARDIVAGQTREMRTMSGWLGDWFGVSGMPGMMGGLGMMGGQGGFGGMMRPGFAGHEAANTMSPAAAEAPANAFLAGRGDGGSVIEVSGPRVSYAVSYQDGDRTGVLLIDALTGEVSEAPAE